MAVTINASTSNGLIQTADTSGSIQLQSNGTTVATAQSTGFQINTYTAGASLITSGTAQATTSGTSIDFTGIPSWVKRITVMVNSVSTSGTSPVQIQLGSGSVTITGYVGNVATTNTTAIGNTAASSGAILDTTATASAAGTRHGFISFVLLSTQLWVWSGNVAYSNVAQISMAAGGISLAGTLDRVRITTVNGTDTFDNGSVNILYE
jgi:hypothetical protein